MRCFPLDFDATQCITDTCRYMHVYIQTRKGLDLEAYQEAYVCAKKVTYIFLMPGLPPSTAHQPIFKTLLLFFHRGSKIRRIHNRERASNTSTSD